MTTKVKSKRKATARRAGAAPRKPGDSMHGRRPTALASSTHVTRAGGNVFADLGFPTEEAANLKMRARFMGELRERIAGMTQAEAAERLHVSQPRVSDLTRGKIGLFTIDALVNMLAHAGVTLRVSLTRTAGMAR
jgi:predicted XRE-type DNA-binding protein